MRGKPGLAVGVGHGKPVGQGRARPPRVGHDHVPGAGGGRQRNRNLARDLRRGDHRYGACHDIGRTDARELDHRTRLEPRARQIRDRERGTLRAGARRNRGDRERLGAANCEMGSATRRGHLDLIDYDVCPLPCVRIGIGDSDWTQRSGSRIDIVLVEVASAIRRFTLEVLLAVGLHEAKKFVGCPGIVVGEIGSIREQTGVDMPEEEPLRCKGDGIPRRYRIDGTRVVPCPRCPVFRHEKLGKGVEGGARHDQDGVPADRRGLKIKDLATLRDEGRCEPPQEVFREDVMIPPVGVHHVPAPDTPVRPDGSVVVVVIRQPEQVSGLVDICPRGV